MIGIALICHGKMAEGMQDSVTLIAGEQENFNVLGLHEGADFDAFKEDVYNLIKKSDDGEGVLVFVDVYGASPFNAASSAVSKLQQDGVKLRIITGVNLPMLIEASVSRLAFDSLDELYPQVLTMGKDSISELFESLG